MGYIPKDAEILPPSDDRIFKLILTAPESKPLLMDLISVTIKQPVVDVFVRNNELPLMDTREKAERLDVNCTIDDGSQIDLEMQASHIREMDDGHENLKGKSVYYLCDLHSSQPAKGIKRYDELVRTYQVTFCTYTVFPHYEGFVNAFSMRHDENNDRLSDAIHIIFVELSKLETIIDKPIGAMTDLEKWSLFFQYADEPSYRDTINRVIESKEVLRVAGDLLMNISKDERERAVFRSRRMYETDLASNMATAEAIGIQKGRQEGIQEGLEKGKIEIARNLLGINMPVDQVMQITGLGREEIDGILSQ